MRTYFLSDLHLGAGYIADLRAHEQRVVRFLDSIAADASALYLVGDVLDYWFEYRDVVPTGFVRFFAVLARLTDAGVPVYWITGNHDIWMRGYLAGELGVTVVDSQMTAEICGKKFYIAHGDNLGIEPQSYRLLRRIFHNRLCQRLYGAVHPRWTVGLAHAWSRHSRESEPATATTLPQGVKAWATRYASAHPGTDYIVLGHYHLPVDETVGKHCRLLVLGDWLTRFTYGVFDGKSMHIEHFESQ